MAKQVVNITIDPDLLAWLDQYAETNRYSRSSLLSLAATEFRARLEAEWVQESPAAAMLNALAETGAEAKVVEATREVAERRARSRSLAEPIPKKGWDK